MSIKNKLVTAVTTAGLLAGLFGSAFVPSAYGAGRTSGDTTVKAKYTTVTVGAADVDAIGTSTSKFQVESSLSSAGSRMVDGTVAAGDNLTFGLFTAGALGAGTTALVVGSGDTLKATSSNSAVVVAWAYSAVGANVACTTLVGDDSDNTDAVFSVSDSVTDVLPVTEDGSDYKLCVTAKTATSAGTSTITVSYNGTTAGSVTVTAVGPVASLTASIAGDYKYIAEENEVIEDWLKVVAKDAAGTIINGAANTASANTDLDLDDDESSLPENAQGDVIEAFLEDGNAQTDGATSASFNRYSVAAGVCTEDSGTEANPEGDGDAGKSYSFKVASDDVVSNAITITCTKGAAGARITKVAVEATTGDLTYDEAAPGDDLIDVIATVVDADGRPLGDGTLGADFNEETALELDTANADLTFVGHDFSDADAPLIEIVGGEALLATLAPDEIAAGKTSYSFTLASIDLGAVVDGDATSLVEKTYTFAYYAVDGGAYTATISKTINKAKTQATVTADMGDGEGLTAITFTVELPSGATRTFKRKANADGIAVLRLNMRNKIVEVYAVNSDDTVITDPTTIRFR